MSGFDALLITYRQRAGLSQKALARAVGVDDSYINRLERGTRVMPRPERMRRLVAVLGLDATEQQTLALVGLGLLDASEIVDRMQHATTMRTANALIAACPCGPCTTQREQVEHTA